MLSFHLDTTDIAPLYEQIYHEIKKRILNGTLPANQKLPSTRSLSSSLGVSRSTVDTAYYQLQDEGLLESKPKSGFYVCNVLQKDYFIYHKHNEKEINDTKKEDSEKKIMEKNSNHPNNEKKWKYDFFPNAVDISHFPFSVWKRLSRQCLDENNDLFLLGNNFGDETLRIAVCDYVSQFREVHCSPEQIIIGAGVDYLLQMLSLTLKKMGMSSIAMENPCYKQAANIFSGNDIIPIPGTVDRQGLVISTISSKADIVYVTPSHEYPLGVIMPFTRRKELLQWAATKEHRYIIEDDHDSEFRYKGKPLPSLQGMSQDDSVIYIGTFSKSIAPAIRAGYMILPPSLLSIYKKTCGQFSCTISRLEQAVLTRFLAQHHFEKHVSRMRKIYRNKHDAMLHALAPAIAKKQVKVIGDNAGLHLILLLPPYIPEQEICQKAKKTDMKLYGLREHYLPAKDHTCFNGLLFGYSNLSLQEIHDGIQDFIQLLNTFSDASDKQE